MVDPKNVINEIKKFIIISVDNKTPNLTRVVADKFGISRQAVSKHLKKLEAENIIVGSGKTSGRSYELVKVEHNIRLIVDDSLEEDKIWELYIQPHLTDFAENVMDIWMYGVTELINNIKDHSNAKTFYIFFTKTYLTTQVFIKDDGIGIFKKIREALNLPDERLAVLELAKGKLTTDPKNHTGEGIFFSSRIFDFFLISSGKVCFSHNFNSENNVLFESIHEVKKGTVVTLELDNYAKQTLKEVFDEYTNIDDDYSFNKTIVPIKLAQFGSDKLISRSQAKRVLNNLNKFKIIFFDFDKVDMIGQAFADEIFRVYKNNNLEMELNYINANQQIESMIKRALNNNML